MKDEEGYIWHCFCVAVQPEHTPEENNGKESAAAVDTDVRTSDDDRVNG